MNYLYLFFLILLAIFILLCISWLIYIIRKPKNTNKNTNKNTKKISQEQSPIILAQTRIISEPIRENEREIEQKNVEIDPPEIQRLKKLLQDFQSNDAKWDILLAVGDTYRKGAFPRFLPDEYSALNCYKLAAMCPDGDIAGLAQAKYVETRTEKIEDKDRGGIELPTYYAIQICKIASDRLQSLPSSSFSEKPRMKKEQVFIPVKKPVQRDYNYDFFNEIPTFDINLLEPNENIEILEYRRDSQNVHDHSVINTSKRNLQNIKTELSERDKNNLDNQISKITNTLLQNKDCSDRDCSDALKVVESLSETKNSAFDMSEKEALIHVWNKIQSQSDDTLKNNLVDNLVKQLASGVEHGHVVCSTGKITRVLSTFDGTEIDGTQSVKPLWAVKEEISSLASKIRDEYINKLNQNEKQLYERGELSVDDMKKDFENRAMNLYCDTLGMSKSIISPIVQTYSDAF